MSKDQDRLVRVTMRIDGVKKDRKYTFKSTPTKGQRRAKEKELREDLEKLKQKILTPPTKTWESAIEEFLKDKKDKLKLESFLTRKSVLNKNTKNWFTMPIDEITHDMVRELIQNLKTSASHKYDVARFIAQVFELQIRKRVIKLNPATGIAQKPERNDELVAMSPLEIKKLLNYTKSIEHDWHSIFYLTYQLGLRSGEGLGLKFSDIDWENDMVNIRRAWKNKQKKYGLPKNGKHRKIPMNTQVKNYIKSLNVEKNENDFVLPRYRDWFNGKGASILKEIQAHIGITETNFHSLRASFITHLILKGVDVARIQKMVGHIKLETTQGYVRLVSTDLVGATDRLAISDIHVEVNKNKVINLDNYRKNTLNQND